MLTGLIPAFAAHSHQRLRKTPSEPTLLLVPHPSRNQTREDRPQRPLRVMALRSLPGPSFRQLGDGLSPATRAGDQNPPEVVRRSNGVGQRYSLIPADNSPPS